MSQSFADVMRTGAEVLESAGVPDGARDVQRLMAMAAGVSAAEMALMRGDAVPEDVAQRFDALVARRARREPLSHITGRRAFYKHEFAVGPDVLDPRPETETLVVAALQGPVNRVIDLGTGSGAILISILAERPRAMGLGSDLSEAALAVAEANAARVGVADRARFVRSDWWSAIDGEADLIVSNPPYIAEAEMVDLSPEVLHEPRMALTDEADGLMAYRAITAGARQYLTPGGRLLVEIGWTQGPAVAQMFLAAGLESVEILADLDGRDRVVVGRNPV